MSKVGGWVQWKDSEPCIGPFSDAITIVWILYRKRGLTCSFGGYKSKIGQLHLSSPHSGHEFTVTESHAEEIERKIGTWVCSFHND